MQNNCQTCSLFAGIISSVTLYTFLSREHFYCFNLCKEYVSFHWKGILDYRLLFSFLNYIFVPFGRGYLLHVSLSCCPSCHKFVFVDCRKLRQSSITVSSCLSWRSKDMTGSSVRSHEPGLCRSRTVNMWMVVQFSTRQRSMYLQFYFPGSQGPILTLAKSQIWASKSHNLPHWRVIVYTKVVM